MAAIPQNILNVIAFDPVKRVMYGLSRNGKNYMKSQDSDGVKWRGVPLKEWDAIKDSTTLTTAVHIPFVPISRNDTKTIEPIVQLTSYNGDKWLGK